MYNWLPLAMLAIILFAVAPILSNKAIQVHGPIMNFLIINFVLSVFSLIWFFLSGRQDISLINKRSLGLALVSGVISFFGIAIIYLLYKMAPKDLSIIAITTSFSVVVLAIINHFLGGKLGFHQWLGAIIAFLGVALVNWKK